jgi:hypothetical protein
VKCDVRGPSETQWKKLDEDEKKLTSEWRETQEETLRLQTHLLEMQSRLLRLDKQREAFRSRAAEMLRRGLLSFEELDREEEKEREEKGIPQAVTPPLEEERIACEPDIFMDPNTDPSLNDALSSYDPNNPFWASLGLETPGEPWTMLEVAGGTSQASQGS